MSEDTRARILADADAAEDARGRRALCSADARAFADAQVSRYLRAEVARKP